ncbi:MAG: ABC transporter permease, partial [Deltaproteobacteria bacterium]|nr:ABC transporter permease [Deltaproteobacteria bacterium]
MSTRSPNPHRQRGLVELAAGISLIIVGAVVTMMTYGAADRAGGTYVVMYGPIVAGVLALVRAVLHLFPDDLADRSGFGDETPVEPPALGRSSLEVGAGLALLIAGVFYASHVYAGAILVGEDKWEVPPVGLREQLTYWLLVTGGLALLALGIGRVFASMRRIDLFAGLGYRSFVAWRYLLVFKTKVTKRARAAALVGLLFAAFLIIAAWQDALQPVPAQQLGLATGAFLAVVMCWGILRYSKAATILFGFGIVLAIGSLVATRLLDRGTVPMFHPEDDALTPILQVLSVTQLAGFAVAGLAMFFGTIRAFFTFFTTVPIGGVWIGTAALVCVLSVMSGFESDLRDKILGSNAHIQITREDGEFVSWREAKAKIDRIPGVLASSPYAVSEVVIAANNNGMNVIIKGIDPATVGKVTDLISDLEDKEAMQRLQPLVDDSEDRSIPQQPRTPDAIDPPPADMASPGAPIDFSTPDEATPDDAGIEPDAKPDDSALGAGPARPARTDDPPFGGDAA